MSDEQQTTPVDTRTLPLPATLERLAQVRPDLIKIWPLGTDGKARTFSAEMPYSDAYTGPDHGRWSDIFSQTLPDGPYEIRAWAMAALQVRVQHAIRQRGWLYTLCAAEEGAFVQIHQPVGPLLADLAEGEGNSETHALLVALLRAEEVVATFQAGQQ
ncbi:hypothetical protein [Deinococcus sp. Leaf326]|uniref:hypothetical protein n=1 Tax=Deinococcus sp. Leaf326 TaxID=1736338 RepID=UPI00070194F8|nr:hypothetical protein [Deinococcus sp. Leaf326]KQR40779.1 hypothetical protein ASF71_01010 [Deinococcus sp. Leaf326]